MAETKIYSRSKWHYDSDPYPSDLPPENAHTHSGFFLVWLLNNDMVLPSFLADHQDATKQLRSGKISPGTFFNRIGETLDDQMLTDLGNRFTEDYFDEMYLEDYWMAFEDDYESLFHVEDNQDNYEIVAEFLSEAFQDWREDNED